MDTTPNIVPTAPEKPAAEAAPKACPKKKGCRAILLLLVLLVLAGAGASIYFFLDDQNQAKEVSKLRDTIKAYETSKETGPDTPKDTDTKETDISTELIQNLIDPYLVADGAFKKVLTQDFDEDAKVKIAFYNLNPYSTNRGSDSRNYPIVYADYFSLRDMYNRLFGSEKALEKKDYGSITYEEQGDRYIIADFGWGGAGLVPVIAIKDYEVSGDKIIVDVAYDNPVVCDIAEADTKNDPDYCIDGYYGNNPKEEDLANFLKKAKDKMPVYRFTFEKDTGVFDNDLNADNGRYVLKDIKKQ